MKGIFAVLVIIVTVYTLGWWVLLIIGVIVTIAILVASEGSNKADETPKSPRGKFVITQEQKGTRKYNNLSNGGISIDDVKIKYNNDGIASDDFDWKLKQKIRHEGLISAVAFVKARTGYDLTSSKKYVEQFVENNNIKLKA